MAIKKLQNNFTTAEQSKRLLELGVPADSADCYYDSWKQIQWRQLADLHNDFFDVYKHYTPCWSVGRLMNLYDMCNTHEITILWEDYDEDFDYIEYIFDCFYYAIENGKMDFSKLEE